MRCSCCTPVSPFTFARLHSPDGKAGGEGDLDAVDDEVRDDDADVHNFVVGKKPTDTAEGVKGLTGPRAMTQSRMGRTYYHTPAIP